MRLLPYLIALTIQVAVTSAASAEPCSVQDSETSCKEKVLGEFGGAVPAATPAAEAGAKEALLEFGEKLAAKNTGGFGTVSPETATSFSDFFTLLKAAADSGSTDDKEDEALAFELSRCMRDVPGPYGESDTPVPPDSHSDSRLQCQLRLRVGSAQLYEPVRNALAEGVREARSKELENGLKLGDMLTAGVFFNIVGDHWGRVPRFATEPLFADIWNVVFAEVSPFDAASREIDEKYEDLRDQLTQTFPGFNAETVFSEAGVSPELAKQAIKAREESWRAEFQSMDTVRSILHRARYLDLVDLVNNQPQLSFGVEYTQRDNLAGPDEWRAKLVYERGMVNVNTARAFTQSSRCRSSPVEARDAAARVTCFSEYLEDPRTQQRLKGGDRLALSLEAVRRRKYRLALPDDALDLNQDAFNSYIGSAAYGFYVSLDGSGDANSRMDLKASYEDVSSDPARQNRGLLVATFTQRVFQKQLVALSLVYATKPEFRGDVDEELSARLGFNYRWGNILGP
jgi:hypothetical protein